MSSLVRVSSVESLGARLLRVEFSDGVVRELDFDGAFTGHLNTIDDDDVFAEVSVDSVAGTVCWPNGVDLDPDVLRGAASASTAGVARLIREFRLESAG